MVRSRTQINTKGAFRRDPYFPAVYNQLNVKTSEETRSLEVYMETNLKKINPTVRKYRLINDENCSSVEECR